jgi:membrane peptidoglycan carboxypeptidase
MTARGPAWDDNPAAARLEYDPPTAPLPYGLAFGDPYQSTGPYLDQDPAGYGLPDGGFGQPRRRRRGPIRRLLRRLMTLLIGLAVLGGVVFAGLYLVTPSVGNAPALARAFDRAHRAAYPGPPVSPVFAEALVATEDHRFYSEPGIDLYAVARVAAATITGHGAAQGGATLYQQLAKMLYTPGRSGVVTEVEQVMLGIKLDFSYSKAQILRMYADVAYFGHGYYGLAAASCGYFGTAPAGLTLPEAATLAGLVQGPSADDPIAHYAVARAREAHVLTRLVATGKITAEQSRLAYEQGLYLVGGTGRNCTA